MLSMWDRWRKPMLSIIEVARVSEAHYKKRNQKVRVPSTSTKQMHVGVAIHVHDRSISSECDIQVESRDLEILWVCIANQRDEMTVGALYHPPKPKHVTESPIEAIAPCCNLLAGPTGV